VFALLLSPCIYTWVGGQLLKWVNFAGIASFASSVILGGNDGASRSGCVSIIYLDLSPFGIYLFIMFLYIQGLSDILEV